MPLLTKEPWFGPKRAAGWGLSPRGWKGWAVVGAIAVLVGIDALLLRGTGHARLVAVGIVLAGVAVVAVTADRPGGPSK